MRIRYADKHKCWIFTEICIPYTFFPIYLYAEKKDFKLNRNRVCQRGGYFCPLVLKLRP